MERQPVETWKAIEKALGDVMDEDDARGATGEWVAVLGFSQGAKIAASLLLLQQEVPRRMGRVGRSERGFRFGVLMAGRGPLLPVEPEKADWLGDKFDYESNERANRLLRVPTLHVHGTLDPGLGYHQILLEDWCDSDTTTLIEWEGNHRLPIKTLDVKLVVDQIMVLSKQTGISWE